MKRLLLFVLLALVLFALPASAQPNLKNPYKVQFCWDGKDDGGVAVTIAVQVRVTIDGTDKPLVALPTASGTTGCAAGSSLYVLTGFVSSKGTHNVTATLVTTDGEGVAPSPFAFAITGRPPSTVSGLSATQ
jgi:hypothetical protein